MTSKNSSSKPIKAATEKGLFDFSLIMTTFKKNIWLPTLAMIGFFFALPVATSIIGQSAISNVKDMALNGQDFVNTIAESMTIYANDILSANHIASMVLICIGAIMAGVIAFRYLHRRKQVDFYHSLPLKRQKLFVTNYVAGFLFFLIPYAIGNIINLGAIGAFGFFGYVSWSAYLANIAQSILFFLAIYSTTVVAMQLSGSIFAGLKITGIILGVGPASVALFQLISNIFYRTFCEQLVGWSAWYSYTSPLSRYITTANVQPMRALDYLLLIAFIAVATAIGFVLYQKRASEAAGRAIAFRRSKILFKAPLAILGSIAFGLFFYAIGSDNIWLFFGVICGAVILCQLLEIVYAADFKAIKKGWLQTAIITILVCLLMGGVTTDITGFDQYVPAADKVESVSLQLNEVEGYANQYSYNYHEQSNLSNSELYRQKLVKITLSDPASVAAAVNMAQSGVYSMSTDENMPTSNKEYQQYMSFTILYTMKNGKQIAREYDLVPVVENQQNISTIISDQDYKNGKFEIYTTEADKLIPYAFNNFQSDGQTLSGLSMADFKALNQIYIKEHKSHTAEMVLEEPPVGNITFRIYQTAPTALAQIFSDTKGVAWEKYNSVDYPIYATDVETIAFLNQKLGKSLFEADLNKITKVIAVTDRKNKEDYLKEQEYPRAEATYEGTAATTTDDSVVTGEKVEAITDPEQIKQLFNSTYPEDMFNYSCLPNADREVRYVFTYGDFQEITRFKVAK